MVVLVEIKRGLWALRGPEVCFHRGVLQLGLVVGSGTGRDARSPFGLVWVLPGAQRKHPPGANGPWGFFPAFRAGGVCGRRRIPAQISAWLGVRVLLPGQPAPLSKGSPELRVPLKPPGSRRGAGGRCGIEQGAAPRQLPPGCQALIVLALARFSPAKKHRILLGFWGKKKQYSGASSQLRPSSASVT